MTIHDRIAIIGAGHVGATTAYALMLRALFREIVLIDHDKALAEAEAHDISDANALARAATVWAGTYTDAARAKVVVITAGAATHETQSRMEVASASAAIVSACTRALANAGFTGVLIVAANPVDLMARVAYQNAGLPSSSVIGTGTLLDSSRLRQSLAYRLQVSPDSIEAYVLGEHGDSGVSAFSTVRIGGSPLPPDNNLPTGSDRAAVAVEVRDAAYQIIAGKGYTSFGIATAIVRICEAIVRDEQAVLPVSTLLTGQFGIENLYLSLPCILGIAGISQVLVPQLSPGEEAALHNSAEVLRKAFEQMHSA